MKNKTFYVCAACGHKSIRWYGKCPSCGEWNTLEEEQEAPAPAGRAPISAAKAAEVIPIGALDLSEEIRYHTGMEELDRVFGGGAVKGSVILLGGDPGIGKSTILLQICQFLGRSCKVLYISGEESKSQIKLRAQRLEVDSENLFVLAETRLETMLATIDAEKPDIVIIDSIQTVHSEELSSIPGSSAQIRECANRIISVAKTQNITTFLVGHVTKEGALAGPKILEHMVDTVLYFEGEKNLNYRLLRSVKNRFGSTNEIGLFEMGDKGLTEVENPSKMLLSGKPKHVSGTCAICVMEGTRPIFAEVQALVAKSIYGMPRRTASGIDFNRLQMLLAVLEKRLMMNLSESDTFVNVVGGLRLTEPSSDVAVIIAIASSYRDKPVDDKLVAIGEVGLAGELRSVSGMGFRISEAVRLGFERIIIPYHSELKVKYNGVTIYPVRNIGEAIQIAFSGEERRGGA